MSVRHSLLALLAEEPTHGYGLKSQFEQSTAGAWPLNVGQVYTTLARLERDGLVRGDEAAEGAQRTWQITSAGRAVLEDWYASPIVDDPPRRDEFAIKVLLAIAAGSTDVRALLDRQRGATMERLQELTRLKRKADPERELAWVLMLDAMIFKAEAEVRWIDSCEARLQAQRRS